MGGQIVDSGAWINGAIGAGVTLSLAAIGGLLSLRDQVKGHTAQHEATMVRLDEGEKRMDRLEHLDDAHNSSITGIQNQLSTIVEALSWIKERLSK